MKSYLKALVLALRYPLIFVAVQIPFLMALTIYGIINVVGGKSLESIEKTISKLNIPLTILAFVLTLAIAHLILRKKENIFERISFKKISLKEFILILFITVTLSMFIMCLIPILTSIFPQYNEVSQEISKDVQSPIMIINALILAPIFEEVLFRGLVFRELQKHTNIIASVITQGIIFGAFHLNIVQGIYTCLLGIVMAVVYNWTNSIFAAMTMHIGFNFLGTMVLPYLFSGLGVSLLIIVGISFTFFTACMSMLRTIVKE